MTLGCDHPDAQYGATTCIHLVKRGEPWVKYYRWLTGVGLQVELLCPACLGEREAGRVIATKDICDGCREWLEEEVGDLSGVRGRPEIRERRRGIDSRIREIHLPEKFGQVLDLAPITRQSSAWMLLSTEGRLASIEVDSEQWTDIGTIELQPEPGHEPWMNHALRPRLHTCPDGEFIAVVNDYGQKGRVFRLGSPDPTMTLNGGEYHPETVPFSFAFVEHRGRCLAIHRTAWNRLDVSDPATGKLLTDRGPTSYRRGEERPAHYLDYFHGRLVLSPDDKRIVDDGWVWHPAGIPEIWDVEAWLDENVWESEDGPTKVSLASRDYYWDQALCWLDSTHVALGGIGTDEYNIIDGVRVFAVDELAPSSRPAWRMAREVRTFAGPSGVFFGDGQRLLSAAEDGLSVWDVGDEARIGQIERFRPGRQHVVGRELVELRGTSLLCWAY